MPAVATCRSRDASRILCDRRRHHRDHLRAGSRRTGCGVDATSQFPPEALKDKPNVGYMRALSTEGVISVGATLILASERAGPPEVVKTLKTTSVPYVEVPDQYSPQGIAAKVRLVARAVGAEAEGEKLVQQVRPTSSRAAPPGAASRPAGARHVRARRAERPRQRRRPGHERRRHHRAGRRKNVADAMSGYKPLTDEAIVELAPDVIVIMRRSSDNDNHDTSQLLELKGVQSTPAGAAKRIIMMDASICWASARARRLPPAT